MPKLELFGTARCPHTEEMREWLEWKRCEFVEYDVEADAACVNWQPDNAACRCWLKMAK